VQKISEVARRGGVEEKEFYQIINYTYPGDNTVNIGETSLLYTAFANVIKVRTPELNKAIAFRQGATRTTAKENLDAATTAFSGFLKESSQANSPLAACAHALIEGALLPRPALSAQATDYDLKAE
jgi:hypothetical protein